MRRQVPILRCIYPRCSTASGRWIWTILVICITTATTWVVLLEDHKPVRGNDENLIGVRDEKSRAGLSEFFVSEPLSEYLRSRASRPGANSASSDLKSDLPVSPCLSRSGFNAALAAGLIDPPRIEFAEPLLSSLDPVRAHQILLIGAGVSFQNPARTVESGVPLTTVTVGTPMASAADNPTKPIDEVSSLALTVNKIVFAQPKQSAGKEPDRGISSPASSKGALQKNKSASLRFISGAGISSPKNSLAGEIKRRSYSSPSGVKTAALTDRHDSQPQNLSDNLQRFASDFIRANQTDNIADQHRFFADSVHFYSEGDLSLAGVAAATRRYHREAQAKRSEVAGPAVATGPVNGGFFVIEQPVRWSESKGSKVTKGRSVLHLRVVPNEHGAWKITSINEVNK